jgi:hypothetical protein
MRASAVLLLAFVAGACGASPVEPSASLAPAPTEPVAPLVALPTLPADPAALAEAGRIRGEWGLNSRADWVATVASSAEAVDSPLGIPLMPDELAQLEQQFRNDPRSRLIAYGTAQRAQFGGAYVDNAAGGKFVMLFTGDLERHRRALAGLPGGDAIDVRQSRFTQAALLEVLDEVTDEVRAMSSVQFLSAGLDTRANVISVEVKAPDPQIKMALESRFPGMVLVEVHPLPGAWQNRAEGAGWRLLAAGASRMGSVEPYSVQAATTDEQWSSLWAELDTVNEQPAVELATEIVVAFAHGIGSSCPELRLDDVVIRGDSVYSVVSDPLSPRACTDDLVGAAFFVVAIDRSALPATEVIVRLSEDAPGIAEELVVDLD